MDLGLYLAEELKQLTDREMAYMKEVQSIEKNRERKTNGVSGVYRLKGLVFNNETKEIFVMIRSENKKIKSGSCGVFNPSSKTEEETRRVKKTKTKKSSSRLQW